jgi:haloalkane dehalogenase
MQVFIGMWKPKSNWLALSQPARTAYLSKVTAQTRLRLGSAAEALAWGENTHAESSGKWQFFCVWRFPDPAMVDAYLDVLNETGWNDYFATESLTGVPKSPFDVMTRHVLL